MSSNSRWWEFYFVRYAMGTVAGAVIVYFLAKSNNTIGQLLFLPQDGSVEAENIILLAVFGLAYCYFASAPTIVFQAARYRLKLEQSNRRKSVRFIGVWIGIPAALSLGLMCVGGGAEADSSARWASFLGAFALFFVVLPQYYAIYVMLKDSEKLFNFYTEIASKRAAGSSEFIESYRHLKEHGASFLIVLLEILLAVVLKTFGDMSLPAANVIGSEGGPIVNYIAISIFWLIPAAGAWLIATVLEKKFANFE